MIFRKQLILGCIALAYIGCNTISELKLQSKSDFKEHSVKSIPFRYVKQLIVVDANINSSERNNSFIFDTGAFQSKVEFDLAQNLHLETLSKRDNGTAQGVKRSIEMTRLDSISIAGATFYNIGAGKLKYDSKSYSPCIAKDGIIGANLIKLAHWKIDYENKEMHVSKTPFKVNAKNKTYQLGFSTSFLSGVPKIEIEIEGHTIKDVIFDLGYNGGLVIPRKYVDKFPANDTQTLIDQSTAGIFGTNRDTLFIKNLGVKIGEFQTKLPIEFSSLNKALLGNDVLEHFTIFLNYDDKIIVLKPNSEVKVDEPRIFIPSVLNDSLWVVSRTSRKLPIQIGDTLRTVNGYRPKDVFKTHCDYFFYYTSQLKKDTLKIEMKNGSELNIKNTIRSSDEIK